MVVVVGADVADDDGGHVTSTVSAVLIRSGGSPGDPGLQTPDRPARWLHNLGMVIRSDQALRRWALVAFGVFAALTVLTVALSHGIAGRPGLTHPESSTLDVGTEINFAALAAAGLMLTWLRPRNSIGWLLTVAGLFGALCNIGQTYGTRAVVIPAEHLPLGTLALSVSAPLWVPCLLIPPTLLLLRYPSGVLSGTWPRRFDRATVVGFILVWTGYATSATSVTDEVVNRRPPLQLDSPVSGGLLLTGAALLLVALIAIAALTVRRMLRSRFPERQQLAWLAMTAFPAFVLVLMPVKWPGTVGFALIPLAVAVGVLRYRLLGIEVVVRRTMLYAALTGLVLLVFVSVTAGLSALVPDGPAPQVVAASLIAVGLSPVRDKLQRLVDRLVYGERKDPWEALQRLSTPADSPGQTEVTASIVAAVADAVRVPGVVLLAPDGATVATWGSLVGPPVSVDLRYAAEHLGTLAVSLRRGEKALPAADRRLLDAVAPLVATVWYSGRLAADLRLARARLVGATEDERARLRRDLHDGLGPSLTGIGLGLEALGRTTDERHSELVSRLREETSRSLEEVRRIIDDLRPGALAGRTLLAALQDRVTQVNVSSHVRVELDAPASLELAPEIEVAAYRIVDEALVNVLKHAKAGSCVITISADDADGGLALTVTDDGIGLDGSELHGVGMTSMLHRAQGLGGTFQVVNRSPGLGVVVRLPVAAP